MERRAVGRIAAVAVAAAMVVVAAAAIAAAVRSSHRHCWRDTADNWNRILRTIEGWRRRTSRRWTLLCYF